MNQCLFSNEDENLNNNQSNINNIEMLPQFTNDSNNILNSYPDYTYEEDEEDNS